MMELPAYKMPEPRTWCATWSSAAQIFLKRAGTIILPMMILIWFLSSVPAAAGRARPTRRSTTASPA